jgi:hypothetical protein
MHRIAVLISPMQEKSAQLFLAVLLSFSLSFEHIKSIHSLCPSMYLFTAVFPALFNYI